MQKTINHCSTSSCFIWGEIFLISLSVFFTSGCSKPPAEKIDRQSESPVYTNQMSPSEIIKRRALEYGLCLGYDQKNHKYLAVCKYEQEFKKFPVPLIAYGIVFFLGDLSDFAGQTSNSKTEKLQDGSELNQFETISQLQLAGFESFLVKNKKIDKINPAKKNPQIETQFFREISFKVDGESVFYKMDDASVNWILSASAADAIQNHFKEAGGKIIDESSSIRQTGTGTSLIQKVWLMSVLFKKPN